MYIRDAYKKKGDKKYSCLVLVETIRTKKGPRQRTILTLGNIAVPKEKWTHLAEMIKRRLSGQRGMFLDEPEELLGVTESIIERLRRKGKLKAREERPIYHQKEQRVDAHIFISVLAYHLLHAIEYTLREKGETRSWNTIKQILQTHQVVTVVLPDADGIHVHHVRVATEVEAAQGEI
ncbi:MAG: hypothetical protein ACK41Q_14750, partial [Candidatus Brocadia sp.]